MTYTEARHNARMTNKEVIQYLELSPTTIKRYEQTGKTPKAVLECLRMIGGKCPTYSLRNDFKDWSFGSGFLWSPAGEKFTSGDVLAIIYDKQLLRSQRIELEAAKKQFVNDGLDNVIQFPTRRQRKNLSA